MYKFAAVTLLALAQLAVACPEHVNYARDEHMNVARAGGTTPWNYNQGGRDWPSLPGYATCKGNQQAPIDIPSKAGLSRAHKPTFSSYNKAVPGKFGNTMYAPNFTLNDAPNSGRVPTLSFDGETTYLAQWHMHTPAEHPIDGRRAAAELHLVHTKADGTARAVLAVLIDDGGPQSDFISQWPRPFVPAGPNPPTVPTSMDMGPLLQSVGNFQEFYTYEGSLTTPPCTQGKRFFVASKILRICSEQLNAIKAASAFSARDAQPIIDQRLNQ